MVSTLAAQAGIGMNFWDLLFFFFSLEVFFNFHRMLFVSEPFP